MNTLAYILIGAGLLIVTYLLASIHLNLRMKSLRALDLNEVERRRVKDLIRNPYLDRAFDILVFFLLPGAAQLIILRFRGGCPLTITYPRILFYAGLSLIPLAVGYIWNFLPWGREGDIEEELVKLGKSKPGNLSKLARIMWRPWFGVFYILFYVWALVCIFLGVS